VIESIEKNALISLQYSLDGQIPLLVAIDFADNENCARLES